MRAQCTCETRFGVVVVPAAEATAEKLIFHSFSEVAEADFSLLLRQPVYVKVFEKMAKVR